MTPSELPSTPKKRYLWAVGAEVDTIAVGETFSDRYRVVAPGIWLDLTPAIIPQAPTELPDLALPYLKAHPYRLHVPGVYDILSSTADCPLFLLDNAPINRGGQLYPSLKTVWPLTPPQRQVYWLWQIWQLWQPLSELGVAASLLSLDEEVRTEGWRVRIRQFLTVPTPTLADLAAAWQGLIAGARPPLVEGLRSLIEQLRAREVVAADITVQLNRLLLSLTATAALQLQTTGLTSAGPSQARNEDACYPDLSNAKRSRSGQTPVPNIAIVCDGIGGHEGGEVASQIVVRSLQLQLQAFLRETLEQDDILTPDLVAEQLEAGIRVINNLIASQNDSQGRADRQRMGTTLVMALQLPQRIRTPTGWKATNELYIIHVGDSRAYWITPEYCHLLTIDDDLANREVQAARSLYVTASQQENAAALTQAIGTRESNLLHPHIQRFVIEESGVLLLCTDGLSDRQRVEDSWANYIGLIVKDIVSLEAAAESWLELANQKNGHDNTAVVLMRCDLGADSAVTDPTGRLATLQDTLTYEMTEASKVLLYGEDDQSDVIPDLQTVPTETSAQKTWFMALLIVLLLAVAGGLLWWWLDRSGRQLTPETAPSPVETLE
ncbi:PP2C family protein-serine/threonine phosphatase [Almyronema epifaneia]|uniref:PP2C family protein-serine/threonine phosphatase n=1 Tax=Almyronema epifaneia S1 TaxID=2991925 RepID=A0ABW6IIQ3_9CYAN